MAALGGRLNRHIKADKFADDSDYEEEEIEEFDPQEDSDKELGFDDGDSGGEDEDEGSEPVNSVNDNNDGPSDAAEDSTGDESEPSISGADALASISFGALVSAQAALGNGASSLKRKRHLSDRGDTQDGSQDDTPGQAHDGKGRRRTRSPSPFHEAAERAEGKRKEREKRQAIAARASKHAPTEMTSKRAVSRRRIVVSGMGSGGGGAERPAARDPRFMPLVTGAGTAAATSSSSSRYASIASSRHNDASAAAAAAADARARANYAFLDEYRASELAELRAAAKREKEKGKSKSKGKDKSSNDRAKSGGSGGGGPGGQRLEALERQIRAAEDRERARRLVEEERAVVREHRRQEREAVRQGKKPFFLKRNEVKKQALAKRLDGMSERKIERVLEKKRKRRAQKERRNMPRERRAVGTGATTAVGD